MTDIATLESARVDLAAGALEDLRAEVRGAVLEPADPGQQEARDVFNAMHPSNPAVTVRCPGHRGRVAAVNHAREHGLTSRCAEAGTRSPACRRWRAGCCSISRHARRSTSTRSAGSRVVQGGALWADVDRETQAFGLVAPGGVVSDTGVAGLTLGGGYGWVRRKYGLSVDALVEAEVVGADGEVRTASAESNPDLFWAIRGGGGNFGVVTSFTFALQPLGPAGRLLGDLLPRRGDRRDPARLARARHAGAGRGHLGRGDDHVPGQPGVARGDPRSRGGDRRRRLRRGPEEGLRVWRRCASWARRCSTCRARRRTPRAVRLRSAVPAQRAARLLEVAVPRRALRRGDRRHRGGAQIGPRR